MAAALVYSCSGASALNPPFASRPVKIAHLVTFSLALGASSLSAQAAKPMAMDDHGMRGWKELDSFHMLMMETWHPVKKSGDMKPIRAKASVMAAAAKTWAASAIPASCDTKPNRDAIAAVARDSWALSELVEKKGDDAAVKKSISVLHDTFEIVEGGCKPGKAAEHKMDGHKHP